MLLSIHISMQFVWFLTVGHPFLSSNPLSTRLEPELHFLTKSGWMPWAPPFYVTVIVQTYWSAWTPRFSDFGDSLGGWDQVNSEMHLEAVTEKVLRCTWRPWSIKIGGVSIGGWFRGGRFGGWLNGSWDCNKCLSPNYGNVENCVYQGPLRDERVAGSAKYLILKWCSSWCMLYSVQI